MIEILFLIFVYRRLAATAQRQGRSRWWGALGVLCLGGEISGFAFGAIAGSDIGICYLLALFCAGLSVCVSFLVVHILGSGHVTSAPATVSLPTANYDPSNPYNPPRM